MLAKLARQQHWDTIKLVYDARSDSFGPIKPNQTLFQTTLTSGLGTIDLDLWTLVLVMFCFLDCLSGGTKATGCADAKGFSLDLQACLCSVFALVIVAVFRLPGCTGKPLFIPVKQMIASKILQTALIFDERKD